MAGLELTMHVLGDIIGLDQTQCKIVLQSKFFKQQNNSFFGMA